MSIQMNIGIYKYINDEIKPAIDSMRAKGFDPQSFAYPEGDRNEVTDTELLKYFRTLRSTTYNPGGKPYKWGTTRILFGTGIDSSYNVPLDTIFKMLEYVKNTNEVVVLYGHRPVSAGVKSSGYYTSLYTLQAIIRKAKELGLNFYTASELDVRNFL